MENLESAGQGAKHGERSEDLVERFFHNELTAAERAEFERRLALDASFKEEVELHRKALQAIRLQEKELLFAKLSQRGRQLDGQKNAASARRWWWAGGGAALLLAFFCWLKWGGERPPATQSPPAVSSQDSTQAAEPPDTAKATQPAGAPAQKQEKQPPAASAKEKQERLFAEYFKPHKDESLEPSLRGSGEPSASEKFRQLYWDGRHKAALAQFENLPPAAKSNDNLLFVKAECLLASGQADAAAVVYEAVLKNDRTRFMPVASWHLALAWLKSGDLGKAKKELDAVRHETDSPWQADAAALLKALE